MVPIRMYVMSSCPYCRSAARLLTRKGATHIDKIDVTNDGERYAEMEGLTGRDTVPQIFIGARHVGGYDELVELDMDGDLDRLLAGAA